MDSANRNTLLTEVDSPYLSRAALTNLERADPRTPSASAAVSPSAQEPADRHARTNREPATEELIGKFGRRLRTLLCPVVLPAVDSTDYELYVTARTTGHMTPFINGRSWGGATKKGDLAEAFDRMQEAVEALKKGCTLYLSAWMFDPTLKLTRTNASGLKTWGALFQKKARAGVKIRILMTDFSPIFKNQAASLKSFIAALDKLVDGLPTSARDCLKYVVSLHPATHFRVRVGTHHQKFMVLKTDDATIAFCGGLDIAFMRTPAFWGKLDDTTYRWLWHDAHCRLEGLIAHDLEHEFVERWNRERGQSQIAPRAGWKAPEELKVSAPSKADKAAARNGQRMQMQRTVSTQGVGKNIQNTRRDDVWQGYLRLIGCATRYLYMENQYFREARMADAIVKQATGNAKLVVIVVVPSETDDLPDPGKKHGDALQHDFFSRLTNGVPSDRLRVYTMFHRIIHSKILMADDRALSIGSANANPRSFFLDTELNVMLDDLDGVEAFRVRLFAHNLGLTKTAVAGWRASDFIARWDEVAAVNNKVIDDPSKMTGEAVLPFDPLKEEGERQIVIDDVETETADPSASLSVQHG